MLKMLKRRRFPCLFAFAIALVLVEFPVWLSMHYFLHRSEEIQEPKRGWIAGKSSHRNTTYPSASISDEATVATVGTTRKQQQHAAAPSFFLTVDILSVGSQTRPDFLQAQRETMGRHRSVRHFVGVTEQDDMDQKCHDLGREDVQNVCTFCQLGNTEEIVPGAPFSMIRRRRKAYVDFDKKLKSKTNPTGWLCAQKRPMDGLYRMLGEQYNTLNGSPRDAYHSDHEDFPDYLILMDDDTFINLAAVTEYLSSLYDASEPLIMTGCLIRFPFALKDFTFPWGGWGTILSRGALQNLVRPVHCNVEERDDFSKNACHRLEENLFGESDFFFEGMNIAELMNAFAVTNAFADYKNWTDKSNFCVNSDWLWGFFFNIYNIGSHTGNPALQNVSEARIESYKLSEFLADGRIDPEKRAAMEGQCRFERETCIGDESHICHRISPHHMHNLTDAFVLQHPMSYDDIASLSQQSSWKAFWTKQSWNPRQANWDTTPTLALKERNAGAIPVFVYPPSNRSSIENATSFFFLDGVTKSSRIQLAYNATTTPLWIIDASQGSLSRDGVCAPLLQLVRDSVYEKKALSLLDQWKVAFLYWDDSPNEDFLDCFEATRLIDNTRIHRFKVPVVAGRQWNETAQFVDPGRLIAYGNWRDHSGTPVRPLNYGVRTELAECIQRLLAKTRIEKVEDQVEAEYIVQMRRSIDVSHFWLLEENGYLLESRKRASRLQYSVSEAFHEHLDQTKDWSFHFGLQRHQRFRRIVVRDERENTSKVNEDYLATLLVSKIIVVSQKDNQEDSYRLMEALASGAMVMTDPMLTLPKGLKEGESIVVYRSLEDLILKAQHYLSAEKERQRIALAGHRIAMERYRSWHTMERIANDLLFN